MSKVDPIARLHASLVKRETPETIAEVIQTALTSGEAIRLRAPLGTVVRASLKRAFGWSSMSTELRSPVPMDRQVEKARGLAELFLGSRLPGSDDPDTLDEFIDAFNRLIGKTTGSSNFKVDRLNGEARSDAALQLSRRRYNKLFRLGARLEDRLVRLRNEEAKLRLVLVGKAALAPDLSLEDFDGHLPTAAFVAYYAARMKLRSEFTILGQQRPFDELSASLLKWCERSEGTRWWAIAHVFPRADVLARLTDAQRGELLGRTFDILQELADRLDYAQSSTDIDVQTMIVKRGNDSSTWNLLAGAWNRARDHWLGLVDALGMHALLDAMLPGKVLRLMAADVAAWHLISGGSIHPDTLVWRELPKPWLVLRGEAPCTRSDIARCCAAHGIDPEKSGWTGPRPRTEIAAFRPTPELVHGVSVGNPFLASVLKRLNAFSGKPISPERIANILRGD